MTVNLAFFNTWAGCLIDEIGDAYWEYLGGVVAQNDVVHLSEVHSFASTEGSSFVDAADPGHRPGPLFVRQHQVIQKLFGDTHFIYFTPHFCGLHDLDNTRPDIEYGNLSLIRRDLPHHFSDGMVYRSFNDFNDGLPAARSIQSIIFTYGDFEYQSVSWHGMWDERGKIDTPHRVEQTDTALAFTEAHRRQDTLGVFSGAKLIMGGDFNLTSECDALERLRTGSVFGESGGVNLNHLCGVSDTRTGRYPPEKPNREADFVIAESSLIHASLMADTEAPSDHACLEVECSFAA